MIEKIIRIKNIGRFSNHNSVSNELSFSENTLIFGDNTNGKSTLVAIFKSLKHGDNNFLFDRKTFGSTDKQEAEILFDSVKKYGTESWKEENIEIFDNDFIKENVFDSDNIGDEQKSGLYSILIGGENRKLSKTITSLKKEQTDLESRRDDIKSKKFKIEIDFKDFLRLEKIPDIDKKIKDKEKEIKQQENLENLKKLLETNVFKSNFDEFKKSFKKTIDTGVEQLISDHIKKTWSNDKYPDRILGEGIKLMKEEYEEKCIFCGQEIITEKSKKLIRAFREKFSQDYDNLKNSIIEKGNKFINIDLEKEILKLKELGVEIELLGNILDAKENIDKKVKEKQNDLNLLVNFYQDKDFEKVEREFKRIGDIIAKLEEKLKALVDIFILKNNLKSLQINKKRFNDETKAWVKSFNEKEGEITEKKKEIKEKTEELAKKVNDIFEKNKDYMNYFLEQLHADFRINKFEPKKDLKKKNPHYCEYNFVFDKYSVTEDKFKVTFSDSDKRLLAFAMFLSKLKNDKNLENKMIILDDPFSSFDKNRRGKTVICLRDIKNSNSKNPKQKVILTHEESFLVEIYDKLENVKVLKIHKDSTGSSLETVDIENDFKKDQYFKDFEYIDDAHKNSKNLNEALAKTRKCIEHILKRKYYYYLSPPTLKSKSINTYIKEIGDNNLNFNKQELFDLNLHQEVHDPLHAITSISTDTEKVNRLKIFLEFIKNI